MRLFSTTLVLFFAFTAQVAAQHQFSCLQERVVGVLSDPEMVEGGFHFPSLVMSAIGPNYRNLSPEIIAEAEGTALELMVAKVTASGAGFRNAQIELGATILTGRGYDIVEARLSNTSNVDGINYDGMIDVSVLSDTCLVISIQHDGIGFSLWEWLSRQEDMQRFR